MIKAVHVFIQGGWYTDVFRPEGYSRFPGRLSQFSVQYELARLKR